MPFKNPQGRPRSAALQHLANLATIRTDECQWAMSDQKSIVWTSGSRSPSWISCTIVNGSNPPGMVPVQICGVIGCVNGRHWRWGTMQESFANRRFKDRQGANNPNSKLNWEYVKAIRSIRWEGGDHKMRVAKSYGISLKTLNAVLKNWVWKEADMPSVADKGDEF